MNVLREKDESVVVVQVRAVGVQDQGGSCGGGMKHMDLKYFKLSPSKCQVL